MCQSCINLHKFMILIFLQINLELISLLDSCLLFICKFLYIESIHFTFCLSSELHEERIKLDLF